MESLPVPGIETWQQKLCWMAFGVILGTPSGSREARIEQLRHARSRSALGISARSWSRYGFLALTKFAYLVRSLFG